MKAESPLYIIIKREFKRITERKTLYILSIFLPLILFTFLALIYKNEVVTDLPIAVIDDDKSEISRMLMRSFNATSSLKIVNEYNTIEELKNEFRKGNIQAAVYIPNGFYENIKSGKYSNVVVYKNSSSVIIGTLIYRDAVTVIKTFSGGILLKKLQSKKFSNEAALNLISPIKIETNSLYNPNYNYMNYLIPGLVTSIFQMIIMMTGVLILSSEFSHNTYKELLKIGKNNIFIILLGKIIPHLLIHFATSLAIIGILFPVFNIVISGKLIFIIGFIFYFVLVCLTLSIFISIIFKKQLLSTEMVLFLNTPAFIFSGFTFPLWGMPAFHNIFAQIIPFTHFLSGFIKLYQMNTNLIYILPEVFKLSVFLILSLIGTFVLLNSGSKYYSNLKEEVFI